MGSESSIHISSDPNGLQRSFKVETVKAIKPTIHFEDSLEHAMDISNASPNTKVILVRQPWNYHIYEPLPQSIIVPNVRRNTLASYKHYLSTV